MRGRRAGRFFAAGHNGRSSNLASTCELQSRLKTELSTFLDRDGLIANGKSRVSFLEEIPVDGVSLVDDDLLKSGYLKLLELA